MKKRIKPGTWVAISAVGFIALVAGLMIGNYVNSLPVNTQASLGLYNNHNATRKVNERVELAVKLNIDDKTAKTYPIQLEGRANGSWQVVKKYSATKPDNTVVFRVHPAVVGDIIYRAEVITPKGVITTNELVLHITK